MSEEVVRTYAFQYGAIIKYLKENSEDIGATLDLLERKIISQIPQIQEPKARELYTRTLAVTRSTRTILRNFDVQQLLDSVPKVEEEFPGLYQRRLAVQMEIIGVMKRVLFGPPMPRGRIVFDIPKLF